MSASRSPRALRRGIGGQHREFPAEEVFGEGGLIHALHLNGLADPVRQVFIEFDFQQMLTRLLHRTAAQLPGEKAVQIRGGENVAVKGDAHVSGFGEV